MARIRRIGYLESLTSNKWTIDSVKAILLVLLLILVLLSVYGLYIESLILVVFCGFTNLALVKLMLG